MSQKFPNFFKLKQAFPDPQVEDIDSAVEQELARLNLKSRIQEGDSVAVTAGSRGIANIAKIIRGIVVHLKSIGAKPFIVPAMGSHGGGTSQGQREVIEGYGITEDFCGCEIRSSMETVVVCQAAEGFEVHFDRNAFEADHVVVCGRVKPHTDFSGPIESGLMKMMLIGLGKHNGAKIYHRAIQDYSFGQIVLSVGREVLSRCKILAGVGIVENAHDHTGMIKATLPEDLQAEEEKLLVIAKSWMPKLPFDVADVLLIDEIGKDISGSGMDTNIVGRKYDDHKAIGDEVPKVKRIAVRGLSKGTHGNATGIGIAEFCRKQLVDEMNYNATRVNCVTSGHVTAGMLPIYFDTDQEMIAAAISTIGLRNPENSRVMWIKNTLEVVEVICSQEYLNADSTVKSGKANAEQQFEILTEPHQLPFGPDGNLRSPWH